MNYKIFNLLNIIRSLKLNIADTKLFIVYQIINFFIFKKTIFDIFKA